MRSESVRAGSVASLRLTAAAVVLLALGPAAAAQQTVVVEVSHFDFVVPGTMTHFDPIITEGDTVSWVWQSTLHSTTSVQGTPAGVAWNSMVQNQPFTFNHTFNATGVFWYYCTIHGGDNLDGTANGMSGRVIVNPVPEPSGLALLGVGLVAAGALVRWRRSPPAPHPAEK